MYCIVLDQLTCFTRCIVSAHMARFAVTPLSMHVLCRPLGSTRAILVSKDDMSLDGGGTHPPSSSRPPCRPPLQLEPEPLHPLPLSRPRRGIHGRTSPPQHGYVGICERRSKKRHLSDSNTRGQSPTANSYK